MRTATLIFFIVMLALPVSCVNVRLSTADDQAKRASGVKYLEPGSPFTAQDRPEVDAAWKNSRNGNAISFLSDCKDPTDPPLDNILQGVLVGLTDLHIENRETVTVQGREGRRVVAFGKVDGVPSGIDLLAFKRNQCIYILSYVGVKAAFNENRAEFTRFIEGFRAP